MSPSAFKASTTSSTWQGGTTHRINFMIGSPENRTTTWTQSLVRCFMCNSPGRALSEVTRTRVCVSQDRFAGGGRHQPKPRPAGFSRRIHRCLSRVDLNELHVMTLAFDGTGKPLVARAPPAPATARNDDVPTVD